MNDCKLDQTHWQISVQTPGEEKNPLLIIDNFCSAPEMLVSEAEQGAGFIAQASDFYPGLRKPLDSSFGHRSLMAIAPLVAQYFSLGSAQQARLSLCAFSLTTTPPTQLRPIQAVPHIDTHDPSHFAMVLYLCAESFGGTSLYRHRSTGFESINEERLKHYFQTLKQEVMAEQKTTFSYINGDTNLFERIAQVPVVFNRAIIYRSNQLHSGDIDPATHLDSSPRTGRLTLNSFFHFS